MLDATQLPVLKQCPVCSAVYNASKDIALIEENEAGEVLHVTCQTCRSALLVCTVESEMGMSSVGALTDLSFEDAKRFRSREELKGDDVLYLHEFLQNHSNTISNLFRSNV